MVPVMSEARIGSVPFFHRGIDRVLDAPSSPAAPLLPDLPDGFDLAPSAQEQPNAVFELFACNNLESLLDAWVRPAIVRRELLEPQGFRAAIAGAAEAMARAAGIRRYANPRVGKLLDRAGRVLEEEEELRELLQMFRTALLQA
jgi:hypothetical protein